MLAPSGLAEYTQPYQHYFYHFEEGGSVVTIPAGRTICYTEFLFEVLESLGSTGAPPLGTLLLAIIATGTEGKNILTQVAAILERAGVQEVPGKEIPFLKTAFKFLDTLSNLPPQYRQGARRLQVLQTIFMDAHNIVAEWRMTGIIGEYKWKRRLPEAFPYSAVTPAVFNRDLRPLAQLHYKFRSVEALLAALAAIPELKDLPFDPEPQIAEKAAPKDFIEELERHPDTFHAASLVRRIWSGLQIPFHSNHPSTQPLGGIADVTNRGALDKLLLSEHANEEDVFLSRLANGEALYNNRETPPETSRLQRILLIDSSLQAWGTPRTLSYAFLLAIAHHPKTDMDCVALAVGGDYFTVSISSVHELIDSLQLLDTSLNAAPGLDLVIRTALPKGRYEVLFLTSPQGLKQPAVQKALGEHSSAISYCITSSDEGECTVYKRGATGLRHLQSFTLPLDELWQKPPQGKPGRAAPANMGELPSEYPILFPTPRKFRQVFSVEDGQLLAITTGQSLLQCAAEDAKNRRKGWRFLMDKLPAGHCLYEVGVTKAGHLLLMCYVFDKVELQIINVSTKSRASLALDRMWIPGGTPCFLFHEDGFLLLSGGDYLKFTLAETAGVASVIQTRVPMTDAARHPMFYKYEARREALAKSSVPGLHYFNTLKHLKRVYISDAGHLALNSHHQLQTIGGVSLSFCANHLNDHIEATHVSKSEAVFPDGSKVLLNANGMLVLKSSGELPDIYIPSVLDGILGASADGYFTGNSFYNPGVLHPEKILKPGEFYNRYIAAFIDHITHYVASA